MHVGLGTFNPVEVEDLSKHKMDSEELFINEKACNIINGAKANKNRICAVGTTSMRGLESSVSSVRTLNPYSGWTHKFIFPPYDFRIADSMITNFHTPKSTLLMMASAFAGPDFIKEAYSVAIKEKYNLLPILIFLAGSTKTSHNLCSSLNSLNKNTSILAPVFSLLPINLAGKTLVLLKTKASPSSK